MKSPALDVDEEGGRSRAAVSDRLRLFFRKYATLIGLVVLVLLFTALKPKVFLTVGNVRNILVAVAVLGVAAVGQTVVFALNDFDMSVGSVADEWHCRREPNGLSPRAVACGHCRRAAHRLRLRCFQWVLGRLRESQSFRSHHGNVDPFAGLSYLYNHSVAITGFSKGFLEIGKGRIGPVPVSVIVLRVVAVIAYFVMERTTVGRRWYAVGGNYDASYLAGIRVKRLRLLAFVSLRCMRSTGRHDGGVSAEHLYGDVGRLSDATESGGCLPGNDRIQRKHAQHRGNHSRCVVPWRDG